MKFDLIYLEYQLIYNKIPIICRKSTKKISLIRYELVSPITEYDSNCLYVIPFEQFVLIDKQDKKQYAFLVMGCPADFNVVQFNGILVGNEWHNSIIINTVNKIFTDYFNWFNYLSYNDDINLNLLMKLTTPILHSNFHISTSDFQYLCKNDLMNDLDNSDKFVSKYLVDLVINNEKYNINSNQQKNISTFKISEEDIVLLRKNFFSEGKYIAQFVSAISSTEYLDVISNLFEFMALKLETYFNNKTLCYNNCEKSSEFRKMISDVLNSTGTIQDNLLNQYNWRKNHSYQIIVFQFDTFYPLNVYDKHVDRQISNVFSECCVILKNSCFICLRNITFDRTDLYKFRKELAIFLRENICKAGISNVFNDLEHAALYLSQAYKAIEIGEQQNPTFWYYFFKEHTYNYILNRICDEYPIKDIINPSIQLLKDYDIQSEGNLYLTLKEYILSKYNASKTAEILFIHRSTLQKRLSKIISLTGLDLDNSDVCLWLQISFKILERNNDT